MTPQADTGGEQPKRPSGIGGWFILVLAAAVIVTLWIALPVIVAGPGALPLVRAYIGGDLEPEYQLDGLLATAILVLNFLTLSLALVCVVGTFRRKRQLPALMIAFFLLGLLLTSAKTALFEIVAARIESDIHLSNWPLAIHALLVVVLVGYLRRSSRVANTFVR